MKIRLLSGITVGFFISIPWMALMYAGQQLVGLPNLPFELFEYLAWSLPGGIISLGIEYLIKFVSFLGLGQTSAAGKAVEIAAAYILTLILLSAFAGLYAITLHRLRIRWTLRGLLAGSLLTVFTALLVNWGGWGGIGFSSGLLWLLLTGLTWGIGLSWGVDRYLQSTSRGIDSSRRRVLGELAIGSLALSGLAIGIGRWFAPPQKPVEVAGQTITPEALKPSPTPPPTKAGFEPVPGTRPEITPIEDFYRVDINLLPPGDEEFLDSSDPLIQRLRAQGGETELPADTFKLAVDGLVKNPLLLSLDDLKSYPMVEQYATLECISNPIGGDLISTTLFQGARLKDILETAELDPSVVDIKFTCVDGYSESLPLQSALHQETLLCYSMGNQALTESHGAPIRLYTPNRFGIKNPKWIVKIEAIDSDYFGFWQKRGWSESGLVKTTAVIDTIQTGANTQTLVGGIAFSGSRGIQSVELRVDEGEWTTVVLNRALSHLTWVLWRTSIELPPGKHKLTVRAVYGKGGVQTGKRSGTHPNGATGYHSKSITI